MNLINQFYRLYISYFLLDLTYINLYLFSVYNNKSKIINVSKFTNYINIYLDLSRLSKLS